MKPSPMNPRTATSTLSGPLGFDPDFALMAQALAKKIQDPDVTGPEKLRRLKLQVRLSKLIAQNQKMNRELKELGL